MEMRYALKVASGGGGRGRSSRDEGPTELMTVVRGAGLLAGTTVVTMSPAEESDWWLPTRTWNEMPLVSRYGGSTHN